MRYSGFIRMDRNRRGVVILLSLLIIVVLCGLIWLNPFAFSRGSRDENLPWNQLKRIVPANKTVPAVLDEQPKFETDMGVIADCTENGLDRGKLKLQINPEGRVWGNWHADYSPRPQLRYEVVASRFKGNIDSQRLYEDDTCEDPSRLFIISKGFFTILETDGNRMKTSHGDIFVTGWVSRDYSVKGKVTITSNRKTYHQYDFSGQLAEVKPFPFDLPKDFKFDFKKMK